MRIRFYTAEEWLKCPVGYLSVAWVAAELDTSRGHVRLMHEAGTLPGVVREGELFISAAAVRAMKERAP